ncbi:hypothetical protein [Acinetobacter sp. YH12075]|uniref:hypothetical protein n=1 Tax=Acinetobacter sp. YH12075 TaxID=2601070 RepID=UPI0015D15BD8|nr:hypothetical protein [Acinetobacter sp. YH12075]
MKTKILLLAVVLGCSVVSHAKAEGFCKIVPVITGEFASESLFDPTKTQIKYEEVCSLPEASLKGFVADKQPVKVVEENEKTTR